MKVGRIPVRERSTGPTRVANSFECDNRLLNAIKKPFKTFKTTKVPLRQPSRSAPHYPNLNPFESLLMYLETFGCITNKRIVISLSPQ